jgi:hypothetical protein
VAAFLGPQVEPPDGAVFTAGEKRIGVTLEPESVKLFFFLFNDSSGTASWVCFYITVARETLMKG